MNEQRLQELGVRLKAILKEYEIEDEGFQLKVFVKQSYYDSIKDNFSTRNALRDVIVGIRGENWAIDLMYLTSKPISTQE